MPRNRLLATESTERDVQLKTQAGGAAHARRVAEEARRKHGDVSAVLKSHPELLEHRTIVIELAYEEFLKRRRSGESVDTREFAACFPGFETSLFLFLNVQSLLGDADTPSDDLWPQPGDTFLGFSILDELGRGAFARVFLATEDALGDRLVALKVARHGDMEATILGRLDHPHIVPVHSVQQDSDSGLTAVCMPYLGRSTLSDVLDRGFAGGRMPRNAETAFGVARTSGDESSDDAPRRFSRAKGSYEDEVVRFGVQLADALAHSHQRGICHRDIKPSNVLLAFDGRPLLLDFNLSIDQRSWLDRVGGTLPYMAPEDLSLVVNESASSTRADPRSDVFSIGVILYQLLTGRLPFEPEHWASSTAQTAEEMLACQQERPLSLRRSNRGVTAELEEVVFDCLRTEPNERIQTATELAARLRAYFRPTARVKRWLWRHPRRVATAAGLASLALAAWGTYLALRPPYHERMLAAGLDHHKKAEYELALEDLNEAVRYNPESAEPLVARAKTYCELEQYDLAWDSFAKVNRMAETPNVWAAMGYCAAEMGQTDSAVRYCSMAQNNGESSLAVLNNLGAMLRLKRKYDEAEEALELALEADPSHPVLCENLLVVHRARSTSKQTVSEDALLAADRAAEYGRPSATLYNELASVYAIAARENPDFLATAIRYLELAVEHGASLTVVTSSTYAHLSNIPEYESLVARALPGMMTSPGVPERLIRPF